MSPAGFVATALSCPACGRSEWRPDLVAEPYRLVRCRCGLRALDAPLDASVALTANEEKYGGEDYNAWYRSMREVLRTRYARDCAEIEALRTAPGSSAATPGPAPISGMTLPSRGASCVSDVSDMSDASRWENQDAKREDRRDPVALSDTSDTSDMHDGPRGVASGWTGGGRGRGQERGRGAVGGRLLDVGCAYGWFLEVAAERGWEVAGVEAAAEPAEAARASGLNIAIGTLEDAAYPDASFDVVCLWDVLEHVPGIDGFLAEIRRILKPGGLLAVQSPNIRSVMARQAGAAWSWLLLPHHVWHFTPPALKQTLERRGFEIRKTITWEPPEAFVGDLQLYKRHPRLGAKGVRRFTDVGLSLAERAWCRAGFGGLVKAYAVKAGDGA